MKLRQATFFLQATHSVRQEFSMIDNRTKNFLLSTVLMNYLVQQSLPETTDEEYSPYRENFHSVEDFM